MATYGELHAALREIAAGVTLSNETLVADDSEGMTFVNYECPHGKSSQTYFWGHSHFNREPELYDEQVDQMKEWLRECVANCVSGNHEDENEPQAPPA